MLPEFINEDLESIRDKIIVDFDLTCKNCLVSGGAGFIGSWVCDLLIKLGCSVVCVDNLSSGLTENISHLMDKGNFKFVKQDIVDFKTSDQFDIIFHFASRASPDDYFKNQIETLVTNSNGTKNLLDIAKRSKSKFIISSTSEVYGDATVVPTPEEYWGNVNPVGDRSCYDEGKRFAEALCIAYKNEFGLDIRIVRIFNTYGPRIRKDGQYGRALPRFIANALDNKDITIFGDGKQTRSFCYISDTVYGILLHVLGTHKEIIINIGNEKELSINELAEKIVLTINSKSKVIHTERAPDDPHRRRPDITKAKNHLKWNPVVDLDLGLKKTIEWFKRN